MADFDVIYQDSRDAGQSSTSGQLASGRSATSLRASARRELGGSGDGDSISGSGVHSMHRRGSSNNAIAGTSSGDGVAAIEEDEGSAMVAIVDGDPAPDGSTFATLITPDPVVIRGAGNITV